MSFIHCKQLLSCGRRSALMMLALASSVTPCRLNAQSASDSSAVMAAALRVAATHASPLFVRAFQFRGRATLDPGSLDTLVLRAALSMKLDALSGPPTALRDPDAKMQSLLEDAAWLPWIMRFRGLVAIDSVLFQSRTTARLWYALTVFDEPKPSRPVTAIRRLVLRRGATNAWTVESDSLETIIDGQSFSFARPETVQEPKMRQFVEESRAALRRRGVALP